MIFGVQNVMGNARFYQKLMQLFGAFHRCRADKKRLSFFRPLLDFGDDGFPLGVFGFVNHVLHIFANAGFVCGNYPRVHVINFYEFRRFRFCGTCHTGKLLIHAEIILECNRRKGLIFAANLHTFLRFNRLVNAIRITATFHQTTRVFIDDNHFAIADNVIAVADK